LRRPSRLRRGDTVGVAAPASPDYNRSELGRGVRWLESEGFKVKLGAHVREQRGYLAGSDAQRAEDLTALFLDPEVRAVHCLQGGYGAARLLPLLDIPALAATGKPFCGYSDITSLHIPLNQAGLITFYGLGVVGVGDRETTTFSRDSWRAALMGEEPLGRVPTSPDDDWVECLVPGVAEGELCGGCLTLVTATLGTPWEIDTRSKILVLEDVDEEPYAFDSLLNQLRLAGKLEQAVGIVVGECHKCEPYDYKPGFRSTLSIEDILDDLIVPLGVPAIYGLPIGHGKHHVTLPLGARARLDAAASELNVLEVATEGAEAPASIS
jgi:muramoyltetrapeptide carboxypeptidase